MPAESEDRPAPFQVRRRACKCAEIEREPLFEWTDDDEEVSSDTPARGRVFTIPLYFEAHVGLDYLEMLQTRGPDAAFRWAAIKAIGVEGWQALRSPGMEKPLFNSIGSVILDRIRGIDDKAPKAS
jgi:hypothetical protein